MWIVAKGLRHPTQIGIWLESSRGRCSSRSGPLREVKDEATGGKTTNEILTGALVSRSEIVIIERIIQFEAKWFDMEQGDERQRKSESDRERKVNQPTSLVTSFLPIMSLPFHFWQKNRNGAYLSCFSLRMFLLMIDGYKQHKCAGINSPCSGCLW